MPLEVRGGPRNHLVAFARRLAGSGVVVAAPRLVVRLTPDGAPPLGPLREDTRLVLPDSWAGAGYRGRFTGQILEPEARDGGRGLAAEVVFRHLPVAVLEEITGGIGQPAAAAVRRPRPSGPRWLSRQDHRPSRSATPHGM